MRYRQDGAGCCGLAEQPEQPAARAAMALCSSLACRALPRDRSGRGGHFCLDTKE